MKLHDSNSEKFKSLVNHHLNYDPETGDLTRKRNGAPVGSKVIGGKKVRSRVVMWDGNKYAPEKLAWLLHHGEWPDVKYMGFKNGDNTDWRIENLFKIGDDIDYAVLNGSRESRQKPGQTGDVLLYSDIEKILKYALKLVRKRIEGK